MSASSYEQMRAWFMSAIALEDRHAATNPKYAPQLGYGRHAGPADIGGRQGAVLVLLFPHRDDWHLVLTERASHLATHAGQVSFPGGRVEADETYEQAALREYIEEVGSAGDVEIIGRLPNVNVFASDFEVTPVVAMTRSRPRFEKSAVEVAEILELPLTMLMGDTHRGQHLIVRGPLSFRAPHLLCASRMIWGATWIILGELAERLAHAETIETRSSS